MIKVGQVRLTESACKELRPGIPEECSGSRPVPYIKLELGPGAEAHVVGGFNAALKGRSSTAIHTSSRKG